MTTAEAHNTGLCGERRNKFKSNFRGKFCSKEVVFKGRKYQIYGEMILMLIERDMQFDVPVPNIYDCTLEQH